MRMHKNILMLSMVCFLLLPSPSFSVSAKWPVNSDFQDYERIKTLNLDIFFVGYDPTYLDINALRNELGSFQNPKPLYIRDQYTHISYNLNFTFAFANKTYYNMLKSFILEHSESSPNLGNTINETALSLQLHEGEERDIFDPQSGRSIDAQAVEQWLVDHPLMTRPYTRHTFYIFNFTEFDSTDHTIEHWYSNPILDLDSKSLEDYWRLPWEGSLNEPMVYTFPGFHSDSRVYFLDPSASQWYLKWAYIWWQQQEDEEHTYVHNELDEIQWNIDLDQRLGSQMLADYLAEWLTDLIENLIVPNLLESELIFLRFPNRNASVQILTLVESESIEDFQWIVHENGIQQSYEDFLPFFNWDVEARIEKLSNYPDLVVLIQNQTVFIDEEGWHINGDYFFRYILEHRSDFFDVVTSPFTVTCVNFAMENAAIYFQGRDYTGLGGSGVSFIIMDRERFYRSDGTKKRGISNILIHEIGHAIGLDHTFNHDTANYAGDFSQDPMGYFQTPSDFCGFRKDFFQRTIVDLEMQDILATLRGINQTYLQENPPNNIKQKFETIEDTLTQVETLYEQLNYVEALYTADRVVELVEELYKALTNTVSVGEFLKIALPTMILSIVGVIAFIRKQKLHR